MNRSDKQILVIIGLMIVVALTIIVIAPIGAAQTELVFKQNTEVDLKVPVFFNDTIASGSATCNVTIFQPDGTALIDNQLMTNQFAYHNYTLRPSQTLAIGEHTASVFCSDGSFNGFSTFQYLISPSGTDDNNLAYLILLGVGLLFSVGLIGFGFSKREPWFVMFGGLVLFSVGLWTLLNGIGLYRNELTQGVSMVVLGIAGYISIRTGMEMIYG